MTCRNGQEFAGFTKREMDRMLLLLSIKPHSLRRYITRLGLKGGDTHAAVKAIRECRKMHKKG